MRVIPLFKINPLAFLVVLQPGRILKLLTAGSKLGLQLPLQAFALLCPFFKGKRAGPQLSQK